MRLFCDFIMEKNLRSHTSRKAKRQPVAGLPLLLPELLTAPHAQPNAPTRRPKNRLRHVLYKDHFHLLPRFADSMRQLELPVNTSRMHYDRIYGIECLRQAHTYGDAALRQLTVILMTMYVIR